MARYKFCTQCGKKILDNETCECRKKRRKEYLNHNKDRAEYEKFYRSTKWRKLRAKVLERDNHLCQRCLHKYGILNSERLEAHHIKSRSNYPELELEETNVICICKTCNLQLGTDDRLDFEYEVREMYSDFNIF